MKIRKMGATFGKHVGKTLELGDRLNIVQGGNESGKSTWCGFIRAMLYGISTREHSRAGYIPDKEKFRPWSGENMQGVMEVNWQGRELRIERGSGRTGILSSAIVTDMNTHLTASDIDIPGEDMLGMKREVFERSAFIQQGMLKIDGDRAGELEKRIIAMVGSGDETASHSVAADRLKAWKNRRRYQNRGEIPALEEEINKNRGIINSLYGDIRVLTMNQARIRELRESERSLTAQAETWRNLRAWERANLSEDADAEYTAAAGEYAAAVEAAHFGDFMPDAEYLENISKHYQRYVDNCANYTVGIENVRKAEAELAAEQEKLTAFGALADTTRVAAQEKQERAEELYSELFKAGSGHRHILLSVLLGVGTVSLLGAFLVVMKLWLGEILFPRIMDSEWNIAWFALMFCAGFLGIYGLCALISGRGRKRRRKLRELQEIFGMFGAESLEEVAERSADCLHQKQAVEEKAEAASAAENNLSRMEIMRAESRAELCRLVDPAIPGGCEEQAAELIREVRVRLDNAERAKAHLKTARVRLETVKAGQNFDEFLAADACPPGAERPELGEEELAQQLEAVRSEIHSLELECSSGSARIETVGMPGDIEERLREAREELSKKELELAAIECALDALKRANEELQGRFSPAIEKRAAEIFAQLTGGNFSIVQLEGAQFEVCVRETPTSPLRRVQELSGGTVDELYLAVRLALCLELSDSCPIILDDALVNFDDSRMAAALNLLADISKDRQVILFTCHSREAEHMKNAACANIVDM